MKLFIPSVKISLPDSQEVKTGAIYNYMRESGREYLVRDKRLDQIAKLRCEDMAHRGYFAHVTPEGKFANKILRDEGWILPSFYPDDRNNVESLSGAGTGNPKQHWEGLIGSEHHRDHVLGLNSFWRSHRYVGIGYYYLLDDELGFHNYYCIITSP